MGESEWITTVVALLGIGFSAGVAILTMIRQAKAHAAQLQAEQRRFDAEQLVSERIRVDSVEREHFSRLWEVRQTSYSALAAWLVEFRENVRNYAPDGTWSPTTPLDAETIGQIVVYGDYDVYERAELLRGGFAATLENVASYGDMVPEDFLPDQLTRYSDEAFTLLMTVREKALRLPDWNEPISLRAGDRSAGPKPPVFG